MRRLRMLCTCPAPAWGWAWELVREQEEWVGVEGHLEAQPYSPMPTPAYTPLHTHPYTHTHILMHKATSFPSVSLYLFPPSPVPLLKACALFLSLLPLSLFLFLILRLILLLLSRSLLSHSLPSVFPFPPPDVYSPSSLWSLPPQFSSCSQHVCTQAHTHTLYLLYHILTVPFLCLDMFSYTNIIVFQLPTVFSTVTCCSGL